MKLAIRISVAIALLTIVLPVSGQQTGTGGQEPNSSRSDNGLHDHDLPKLTVPPEGNIPVAIVIGADAEVLDFCGPLEVFANAFTPDWKPLFDPFIVASTKEPVMVGGGMTIVPEHSFATSPAPKIILVPAMNEAAVTDEMLNWLRKASRESDLTMSVCNGSFVLARADLLTGKEATCHHGGYFRFAGMFPDVMLRRGARFVEDGRFLSSGGVASGMDLALRVVERYLGLNAAMQIADGMEYQGTGWRSPDSNSTYSRMPDFNEDRPVCPLCLMEGDRSIATVHNGKTLCFCHESEKDFFEKHKEVFDRFLKEDNEHQSENDGKSVPSREDDRPIGLPKNAWAEDLVQKKELEAKGDVAVNEHVVLWYPKEALTNEETTKLLDELQRGIIAAKTMIGRPEWNCQGDRRIYYYLPDADFISRAPGGNCAFIPLWRMKERKAPWLHESLHLLLKSKNGDWLEGDKNEADQRMPLWLHEGLADALAIDISLAEGLEYYSPLIEVPANQLDASAARTMREAPSPEIIAAIGGRGKPQGLFGADRVSFAVPFYNGSASFVRFIAKRHGYGPLLKAIDDFQHENETLERETGESLNSLKSAWIDQIMK